MLGKWTPGDVGARSVAWRPAALLVAPAGLFTPDIVAYQVRDGERSGLYVVRLGEATP